MEGSPGRRLGDLLAAAESVRDDQRVERRPPHGRKEDPLRGGDRYRVVIPLKAEPARHAATARIEQPHVQPIRDSSVVAASIFSTAR